MFRIILLVCLFAGSIAWGLRKLGKRFAQDLANILKQAHLGHLPAGVYSEQYISAKRFSRGELCLPIDADTLHQMDHCITTYNHDVSIRVIKSKASIRRATMLLSVSIRFDGESEDGKKVHVDIQNSLISAEAVLENHVWYLAKIRSISC